jgi:hypothetical protein
MTVTDERDKRTYALTGNTVGVTPGDRMKLQAKKAKPKAPDKTLVWEAREVTKDFRRQSAAVELHNYLKEVAAVDSLGGKHNEK